MASANKVNPAAVASVLVDAGTLYKEWRRFADWLAVKEPTKDFLGKQLNRSEISYEDLFGELLKDYANLGENKATIGGVRDILIKMEQKAVEESLGKKFSNDTIITTSATLMITNDDKDSSGHMQNPNVPTTSSTFSSRPGEGQDGQCISHKQHDEIQPAPRGLDFVDNVEPLEVVVIKASNFVLGNESEIYSLKSSPRGYALIINNVHFADKKNNRPGAEYDARNMEDLFNQMNYQCTLEEDVEDLDELTTVIKRFKRKFSRTKVDSCVVVIMSHGASNQVYMCDDKPVNLWTRVIYQFNNVNCPELQGTPKVFIIQACQDFRTGTDAPDVKTGKPYISDTIVCFPTAPGTSARRDSYKGSWFIYCLAKVFMENAHKMHLVEMLEKVQKEEMRELINQKRFVQVSNWQSFLFNKLYFNPGV